MAVEIPTTFVSETTSELIREVGTADAPSLFGIGLETLLGAATGGGAVGLAIGGFKLFRLLTKRTKQTEVTGGRRAVDPFPHKLDEARQQRELRGYTERRVPEYDAALGRIVEDEIELYNARGTDNDRAVLNLFWQGVQTRVRKLMPPSTREYLED